MLPIGGVVYHTSPPCISHQVGSRALGCASNIHVGHECNVISVSTVVAFETLTLTFNVCMPWHQRLLPICISFGWWAFQVEMCTYVHRRVLSLHVPSVMAVLGLSVCIPWETCIVYTRAFVDGHLWFRCSHPLRDVYRLYASLSCWPFTV